MSVRSHGIGEDTSYTYKVGKLRWVPQEENGSVVGYNVPITLSRPELDRETARITGAIV
jgi:hypothetical protein